MFDSYGNWVQDILGIIQFRINYQIGLISNYTLSYLVVEADARFTALRWSKGRTAALFHLFRFYVTEDWHYASSKFLPLNYIFCYSCEPIDLHIYLIGSQVFLCESPQCKFWSSFSSFNWFQHFLERFFAGAFSCCIRICPRNLILHLPFTLSSNLFFLCFQALVCLVQTFTKVWAISSISSLSTNFSNSALILSLSPFLLFFYFLYSFFYWTTCDSIFDSTWKTCKSIFDVSSCRFFVTNSFSKWYSKKLMHSEAFDVTSFLVFILRFSLFCMFWWTMSMVHSVGVALDSFYLLLLHLSYDILVYWCIGEFISRFHSVFAIEFWCLNHYYLCVSNLEFCFWCFLFSWQLFFTVSIFYIVLKGSKMCSTFGVKLL